MKRKSIFRSAAISLILISTILFTTAFADKYQGIVRKLSMLETVLNEYYVGDVDTYKLQEGIYKGFVSGISFPNATPNSRHNLYSPAEISSEIGISRSNIS